MASQNVFKPHPDVQNKAEGEEITLLQLGSIILHRHFNQHHDSEVWYAGDIFNDKKRLEEFHTRHNIDQDLTKNLAKDSSNKTYELRPMERSVKVTDQRTTYIMRSVPKGWSALDPAILDVTQRNRYEFGTELDTDSSWLDVCIFIGIQMDAGRIQQDQILPHELNKLSKSCLYFLAIIISASWGSVEQRARDEVRSILRFTLSQDPHGIASPEQIWERSCAVDLTIKVLFHNLPQTSFTQAESYMCCDAKLVADPKSQPQRVCSLTIGTVGAIPSTTLGTRINSQLVKPKTYASNCSKGAECSGNGQKHVLILDQLPPTLIVITVNANINQQNEHIWKPFDHTVITYMSARTLDLVSHYYEVVGVIFHEPKTDQYSAHWKRNTRRGVFDNRRGNGPDVRWDHGNLFIPDANETIAALFYRQVLS